ncbi:hypothetical protein AB4Y90_15670 [Chryseobacterium sp. 2TAF14]|uniref:hypothetical protein n=1 Tax=Chryseobacterium sp. 2TAF14 TaxID=3233007 RepID=UPI003F90ACEC
MWETKQLCVWSPTDCGKLPSIVFCFQQFVGNKSKSCLVTNGLFVTYGGVVWFETDIFEWLNFP